MTETTTAPLASRAYLQQIIAGLSEGIILMEPDGAIAWANANALTMHGVTDIEGLGQTPSGYRALFSLKFRNKHALKNDQYPLDQAFAGTPFDGMVVELSAANDPEFERILKMQGLVLTLKDGPPELMAIVIEDMTDRFDAEERFERTFNANPAPAVICRLSDLRYVKVNQGFIDMTGYTREQVLGRSVYEIDVLEEAEDKENAIENLTQGRTISQREATLKLPHGITKLVVVAGQPIEVADQASMLFTFNDLERRRQAEQSLRQSEERFSKAFRLAPVPMAVCARESLTLLDINDAFVATTGHATQDALGQTLADIKLWSDPKIGKVLGNRLKDGESVRNMDIGVTTTEQEHFDCLASAEAVTIHDQHCVLLVLQDITARKRSEVELIAAIETVMQDTSWFSRTVIEKLAQIRLPGGVSKGQGELSDLTAREREVLGMICQGLSDDDIAQALHLSRNTVRNHVATIYSKIDVHRRSAAIVWARERGVIGVEKPLRTTRTPAQNVKKD